MVSLGAAAASVTVPLMAAPAVALEGFRSSAAMVAPAPVAPTADTAVEVFPLAPLPFPLPSDTSCSWVAGVWVDAGGGGEDEPMAVFCAWPTIRSSVSGT